MATLNELAILIAEPLNRELDTPFREMIKARVKYWRSKLLRDSLGRSPKDRAYFIQSIFIKLESTKDCNTLPCSKGLLRSVDKVPMPLRANGILFDYVGTADIYSATPFKYVREHELRYFLGDQYLPRATGFYVYVDGYIYSTVPMLKINMIADDPEQVLNVACNPDGSECVLEESDFGINGDLAQQIVQYITTVDFARPLPDVNKTEIDVDPTKQ